MNLSEIRHVLNERGIRLTRSLGQNFLHDEHHLDRIVAAAELAPTDRVLEIGPGLGPLTERLVTRCARVLAVEKDARLAEVLQQRLAAVPEAPARVQVVRADALGFLREPQRDWSTWKLVSNLPYSVASPILVDLCRGAASPRRLVCTLQLEVVQRLMAGPGTRDYGVLTLMVQLDFEPVRWFKIPSGCFFPEPDVDSGCIVLDRRPTRLLPEEERPRYVRLVKRAFSQRRKMMLKLLKQDWPAPDLTTAYDRVGLSPGVRAEAVSLGQFVGLTRQLTPGDAGND